MNGQRSKDLPGADIECTDGLGSADASGLGPAYAPGAPYTPDAELRRRRDQLAEQVAELHWNLGGLTYEMAIRDHFRLDVLLRRAAMLQEREIELSEIDRLLAR
jgi:hypothetical protein